ncbi:M14 family zinc carboxypeptidase [Neobacillus mesonae]|uniref:M14 family zinc carboxypeptidase n=1 Tax=Neobacillus mesonae TaxID=1193713 RepID=UPI002E2468DF|nr:M14 family zinc carboxypeptidase [Neobacillus mesonae]MED4202469.1 M14 family zinc carboxypeptidase [Neobacillus mesonae]
MKKRKALGYVLTGGILAATFGYGSASVFAEPVTAPNGPWVQDEQNLSLAGLMSNEQLEEKLKQIEKSSQGKMKLEQIGTSNDGYPLYVAKLGDNAPNKKRVLVYTQIHGNETLGTEAAVDLMQKLSAGGKEAKNILDNVTVWFVPRINPDGTANQYNGKQYPTRYSHQTWDPAALGLPEGTKAPWYYNAVGSERAQNNNGAVVYGIPGFDLNRDFNPNYDFNVKEEIKKNPEKVAAVLNDSKTNNGAQAALVFSPETRALTKVVKEFKPDVAIDLHHRGFNQLSEEDKRSVSIQLLALFTTKPFTDPFSGKVYKVNPEVETLSKKVNAVAYESLQRGNSSFGAIQKYPQVNYPGSGLGAIQLNGTATMLIEIKGQTQTLGQKQNGMLIETAKVPVMAVLNGLADGSIEKADPAVYDAIPDFSHPVNPGGNQGY